MSCYIISPPAPARAARTRHVQDDMAVGLGFSEAAGQLLPLGADCGVRLGQLGQVQVRGAVQVDGLRHHLLLALLALLALLLALLPALHTLGQLMGTGQVRPPASGLGLGVEGFKVWGVRV